MFLELLQSKQINYPSGSALEYYNDEFFVVGDDANYVLCLNKTFNETRKINLFEFDGIRIPKVDKPDLECATILNDILYILGSGSKMPERGYVFTVNLKDNSTEKKSMHSFFSKIESQKIIQEINIEGLANYKDKLLFFNRGNTQESNHLIITSVGIFENSNTNNLSIIPIETGQLNGVNLGISDACIDEQNDLLFVTASAEDTNNAYDDGTILGSVIGIVPNFSTQLKEPCIKINQVIKLGEEHTIFSAQKIEAICITAQSENKYHLSLVADNDDGKSVLFDIKLTI